jgi:carbon monoxide dehydrogenase subunit G
MTKIHERIETALSLEETFDYVADFASSQAWDPGVASAYRLGGGPLAVGARFRLDVRMGARVAPMEYRITQLERPHRVVLVGRGANVDAVDDIRFERTGDRTVIDYMADIRLRGLLRLAQPFLGGTFARIGRDAAYGMQRTLDEMAGSGRAEAAEAIDPEAASGSPRPEATGAS